MLGALAYDWWTRGRLHLVYEVAVPAILDRPDRHHLDLPFAALVTDRPFGHRPLTGLA